MSEDSNSLEGKKLRFVQLLMKYGFISNSITLPNSRPLHLSDLLGAVAEDRNLDSRKNFMDFLKEYASINSLTIPENEKPNRPSVFVIGHLMHTMIELFMHDLETWKSKQATILKEKVLRIRMKYHQLIEKQAQQRKASENKLQRADNVLRFNKGQMHRLDNNQRISTLMSDMAQERTENRLPPYVTINSNEARRASPKPYQLPPLRIVPPGSIYSVPYDPNIHILPDPVGTAMVKYRKAWRRTRRQIALRDWKYYCSTKFAAPRKAEPQAPKPSYRIVKFRWQRPIPPAMGKAPEQAQPESHNTQVVASERDALNEEVAPEKNNNAGKVHLDTLKQFFGTECVEDGTNPTGAQEADEEGDEEGTEPSEEEPSKTGDDSNGPAPEGPM